MHKNPIQHINTQFPIYFYDSQHHHLPTQFYSSLLQGQNTSHKSESGEEKEVGIAAERWNEDESLFSVTVIVKKGFLRLRMKVWDKKGRGCGRHVLNSQHPNNINDHDRRTFYDERIATTNHTSYSILSSSLLLNFIVLLFELADFSNFSQRRESFLLPNSKGYIVTYYMISFSSEPSLLHSAIW